MQWTVWTREATDSDSWRCTPQPSAHPPNLSSSLTWEMKYVPQLKIWMCFVNALKTWRWIWSLFGKKVSDLAVLDIQWPKCSFLLCLCCRIGFYGALKLTNHVLFFSLQSWSSTCVRSFTIWLAQCWYHVYLLAVVWLSAFTWLKSLRFAQQ